VPSFDIYTPAAVPVRTGLGAMGTTRVLKKKKNSARARAKHQAKLGERRLGRLHKKITGEQTWCDKLLDWAKDVRVAPSLVCYDVPIVLTCRRQQNCTASSLAVLQSLVERGVRRPAPVAEVGARVVADLRAIGCVVVVGEFCMIAKKERLEKIMTKAEGAI